jgi:DNA primase
MKSTTKADRIKIIYEAIQSLSIEELIEAAQIRGLRERHGKWRGNCPIHGGDSGSFTVYAKSSGVYWNCPTSCGSGDMISLLGRTLGLTTKGRDYLSILNVMAGRLGLPGIEGGELTATQLAQIEKRRLESAQRRKELAEQEERMRQLTHRVLVDMRAGLMLGEREHKYLQTRCEPTDLVTLSGFGFVSWDERILSRLVSRFSADELHSVLGHSRDLMDQFRRRPLLAFTANGSRVTGVQARSIDPDCHKKWRFVSRGDISEGFFNGAHLLASPSVPVVVVEGMTDTVAGISAPGWASEFFDGRAHITLGKAGAGRISPLLAETLRGREVLLCFDGDTAGKRGAAASALVLEHIANKVSYATLDGDLCEELSR